MLTTQNWLNILKTPDLTLKVNKDPGAHLTDQVAAYMVGKDWLTSDDLIKHFQDYKQEPILRALQGLKSANRVEVRQVRPQKKTNSLREYRREYRLISQEQGNADWSRKWLDHETATAWASWVGNA